jgi:outer membrane protein assembly factor BamB
VAGDSIYFGNESNEFICADFGGLVKWRFWAKRPITSSPVESDGVVYFSSQDSNCYALDAKSGWVIWKFRMGKGSVSSLLFMIRTCYFVSGW